MENLIKIINNRLDEQSLIGKESLTIDEIKNILDLVSKKVSIETKKDFATKEQRDTFNEIVSKFTGTKEIDKYPDTVFYMVDDYVYMKQDLKTNNFYIRHSGFWSVFQTKFDLKYQEIRNLLQDLLEEHLKCDVNTTDYYFSKFPNMLEEHLKCDVNTTICIFTRNTCWLEEHLKCDVNNNS